MLNHAVERYFSAGLAASTRRTYSAGISRYLELCRILSVQPTPTSENLLCKFVAFLALHKVSTPTIKVYLSAVHQLHIQKGLAPPSVADMAKLAQVIRGIKITQASEPGAHHNQRLPITPELLRDIKHNWQKQDITEDKIMLWAAFTTCFFGFLRSGELCCQNSSFDSTSDLAVNNMTLDSITNPQVIRIHLKASKTDPFREELTFI